MLTNLIAGIQLAITQPIRIGDAVIVENEWGWVEEITGTYVVIKVWDWRRLVVPLSYFLEKPFQNWTRRDRPDRSVFLWVDYTVPVAEVRAKLEEIVRASKLWDGQVVNLQVVESNGGRAAARPGQRPHLAAGLGPALRGAREADRLPAADLSDAPAQQRAELVEFDAREAPPELRTSRCCSPASPGSAARHPSARRSCRSPAGRCRDRHATFARLADAMDVQDHEVALGEDPLDLALGVGELLLAHGDEGLEALDAVRCAGLCWM